MSVESRAFGTGTGGVKVVQSDARDVDRRRRKQVRVRQGALLGKRGLNALLEGAAVCDAAEDSGNILRVVDVAEAEEHLIWRR